MDTKRATTEEKELMGEGEVQPGAPKKIPQYHPCSWCGGFKKVILEGSGDPEVVITQKVTPQPSQVSAFKGPMIVCEKCQYKVYNYTLGQAQYYGNEMEKVRGEVPNQGFFPIKK